jgi:preprotein translocase subunit YajC
MRSVHVFVAAALLVGSVAVASAQSIEAGTSVAIAAAPSAGTVIRIDPQAGVVVLDDGRMYRVTPSTALIVDDRPAHLAALRPGQRVVIQSGEMVTLRDGLYVTVQPAPATVTQPPATVVTPAPPTVVAQAPAVAVPVGVRQTIHGRIEEVEPNGEVTIRTEGDTFEVKLNPDAMRQVRKNDTVTIDLTFTPVGSPAASPR